MTCEEARSSILGKEDPPCLDPSDPLARHLSRCRRCAAFSEELRLSWAMMDHMTAVEPSEKFNRAVWEKIAALRKPHSHGVFGQWRIPRPAAALAAAALAVAVVGALWLSTFRTGTRPAETASVGASHPARSSDADDELLLKELDNLMDSDESRYLNAYQDWETGGAGDAAPANAKPAEGRSKPSGGGGKTRQPTGASRSFYPSRSNAAGHYIST